jgi:integrase
MSSMFRRGKTYYARAWRGKEFRTSLGTADRAVAEKRFRGWLDDLDKQAWDEKPERTYADAEEKFIREHLTRIKPSSAKRYGVSLKQLIKHFGKLKLSEIDMAVLSAFETKRRLDGVQSSSIRRDLACLSSMLTSCEEWSWLENNPVPAFLRQRSRRGLKEGEARTRYLSESEEVALLDAATDAVRDAITLAIDTGLRREELFSLQWWQIDIDRGLITTTSNTKSGRARKVPLPARSGAVLAKLDKAAPHVLINPKTGARYVAQNKGFKAALRRADIRDLEWHDLRRTAGCRWLQREKLSMEEVSILLGHSSIAVTERRYAFLEAEQVAERVSRPFLGSVHQKSTENA